MRSESAKLLDGRSTLTILVAKSGLRKGEAFTIAAELDRRAEETKWEVSCHRVKTHDNDGYRIEVFIPSASTAERRAAKKMIADVLEEYGDGGSHCKRKDWCILQDGHNGPCYHLLHGTGGA